jgi:hypothetical protein
MKLSSFSKVLLPLSLMGCAEFPDTPTTVPRTDPSGCFTQLLEEWQYCLLEVDSDDIAEKYELCSAGKVEIVSANQWEFGQWTNLSVSVDTSSLSPDESEDMVFVANFKNEEREVDVYGETERVKNGDQVNTKFDYDPGYSHATVLLGDQCNQLYLFDDGEDGSAGIAGALEEMF